MVVVVVLFIVIILIKFFSYERDSYILNLVDINFCWFLECFWCFYKLIKLLLKIVELLLIKLDEFVWVKLDKGEFDCLYKVIEYNRI